MFLVLYTKLNNLVLDAFMGSCTTAIAAYRLGRDFIGFETDAEYYKSGMERLEAVMRQMSFFDLGGGSNGR